MWTNDRDGDMDQDGERKKGEEMWRKWPHYLSSLAGGVIDIDLEFWLIKLPFQ